MKSRTFYALKRHSSWRSRNGGSRHDRLRHCRDIRHLLGVYVLGAIDTAERSQVDLHLSACPDCPEELAGLAACLPCCAGSRSPRHSRWPRKARTTWPACVRADAALAAGPDPGVRRARRWRGLAAAAAVVTRGRLGEAAGWNAHCHSAGSRLRCRDAGRPLRPLASPRSASNPQTHVAATVRLSRKDWGTALDTQVHGVAEGARCQMVVTDAAGHTTVVGSWTTGYDESWTWYPGATSVTLDSVRSFAMTSHGKVLVTVPCALPRGRGGTRRAVDRVIPGLVVCVVVLACWTGFESGRRRRDGRLTRRGGAPLPAAGGRKAAG